MKNNFLNKFKFQNIWIFVTDKCNLNCDYCFFKYRKNKTMLSFGAVKALLDRLGKNKKYDFVVSGGEPLLYWQIVEKLFNYALQKFPSSSLTLQTNMTLLDEEKLGYLKKMKVTLEPGIDGDLLTNLRHRKGIGNSNFSVCLDNLRLIKANNFLMNPTMTVHPHECRQMFNNFSKLASLGLEHIEVHPAFLAGWNQQFASEFINQYRKILDYEVFSRRQLICKDYSLPIAMSLDLVVQPDGYVLPNWTYLSFPYNRRKPFFILKLTEDNCEILESNLVDYLKKLKVFFRRSRSYRDFSNFNAACVLKTSSDNKVKSGFSNYKRLCELIQKLDLCYLRKGRIRS